MIDLFDNLNHSLFVFRQKTCLFKRSLLPLRHISYLADHVRIWQAIRRQPLVGHWAMHGSNPFHGIHHFASSANQQMAKSSAATFSHGLLEKGPSLFSNKFCSIQFQLQLYARKRHSQFFFLSPGTSTQACCIAVVWDGLRFPFSGCGEAARFP